MAVNATEQELPLYEQVYSMLRDLILSGVLKPGETVSEVQLSRRLDVSRTPVREAVKRLVAENLLHVPSRGTLRVYAPTMRDVAEVYHSRALLEGGAARLAATAKPERLIETLETIVAKSFDCVKETNAAESARLNTLFHQAIIEASENGRISALIAGLNPMIMRYRRLSLMFPEHLQRSSREHGEIVRVLRDGTPAAVEDLVRDHILRAGGRVVLAVHQLEGGDLPDDLPVVRLLLDRLRNHENGV